MFQLTSKKRGKGHLQPRRLRIESLEERRMFALVGFWERTDGNVEASVTAEALTGGSAGDVDHGDADETIAYAQAEYESDAAKAEIELKAFHKTAIGDSTQSMYAAVGSRFHAETKDPTLAECLGDVVGAGLSTGTYQLTEEEAIPQDSYYLGHWRVFSHGSETQVQLGVAEVRTDHESLIVIGNTSYWLRAEAVDDREWWVTYSLPNNIANTSGYLVTGTLNVEFDINWSYDEETEVIVQADTHPFDSDIYAGAGCNGLGDYADLTWEYLSEASLRVLDEQPDDEYIPGGILPLLPGLGPPKVADVIISSTMTPNSNPEWDFDAQNADGSEAQLKTVPVSSPNVIAIRFTEDVNIAWDDLRFIALNKVVTEPTTSSTNFDPPTIANDFTATWTLSGPLPAAQYLIHLSDSITDLDELQLDGEWTNPGTVTASLTTTVFPSGNNDPGGDFDFVFTILPGDADRSDHVSGADLAILSANYGYSSKVWADGDFTGNGTVSGADLASLAATFGQDWRNLIILGDYDNDFDLDGTDESTFLGYYNTSNSLADLNKDNAVTVADRDAFYALLDFGIDLRVLT